MRSSQKAATNRIVLIGLRISFCYREEVGAEQADSAFKKGGDL